MIITSFLIFSKGQNVMSEHLKAKTDNLRIFSNSIKRRAGLYSELAKIDGKDMAGSLKATRCAPAPGKKVQKVGFILFWVPEPTGITMAIGAPMMLAGRYLEKKYNSSTLSDIGTSTKDAATSIKDFKEAVF